MGIRYLPLFFHHRLLAHSLLLEAGEIKINDPLLRDRDSLVSQWVKQVHLPFEKIGIEELDLGRSKVQVTGDQSAHAEMMAAIRLSGFSYERGQNKSFPFDHIDARFTDIHYSIPGAMHEFRAADLTLDSRNKMLRLDSVQIIPDYGKFEFAKKRGYQTDRFDISISTIECPGTEILKIFDEQFIADRVLIQGVHAHIFRDRRIPMKKELRYLPIDELKEIPFGLDVKKLSISEANIGYEEFPKEGPASATLKIENLRMAIYPLINHPSPAHDHLDLDMDGSIMGAGSVHAHMWWPFAKDKNYQVRGEFTGMDLVSLNPPAENLGGFHIESGLLDHLYFEFSMSPEKAGGKIVGEYHNLVIDKLKKSSSGARKIDRFKSFALRHFIIPRNKDKSVAVSRRTGKVDYHRDPNRYFSNYLLHSLLSGIKSSFALGFLLPG
jgi:hypothetical protein